MFLACVPVLSDFPMRTLHRLERVVVLGVEMPHGSALAAEDHRLGLGPEVVVDDAVEELPVGHARRRECDILAANEVVHSVDASQVLEAGGPRLFFVIARAKPQAALQVTAK